MSGSLLPERYPDQDDEVQLVYSAPGGYPPEKLTFAEAMRRMLTEDNPRPAFIIWWDGQEPHSLDHGEAKQVAAL